MPVYIYKGLLFFPIDMEMVKFNSRPTARNDELVLEYEKNVVCG